MATVLNVYLNFDNNTQQAMEFYKSIFGGELELHTFKEYGAAQDPSQENLIMHAVLKADNNITFMAADTANQMGFKGHEGFGMSLNGDNEAELTAYFKQLCEGGKVVMPLTKEVWGDTFGMCDDKFGLRWLVNISAPKA